MEKKESILHLFETCKQYVREAEKQSDENGNIDQEILDCLESMFYKIIDFEKMHLTQVKNCFYGMLLTSMNTKVDFCIKAPFDIDITKNPFDFCFNPLYCSDMRYKEFVGGIVKEIWTLIYDHPDIYKKLNVEKDKKKHKDLEDASSVSVTEMMKKELLSSYSQDKLGLSSQIAIPTDSYKIADLQKDTISGAKKDESLSYYFKVLNKYRKNNNEGDNGNELGASGLGSGEGDQNKPSTKNSNNGRDIHDWENQVNDSSTANLKELLNSTLNSLSQEARGLLPSSMIEEIQALMKPPEINWQQILKQYVGNIPIPYRKTRTRLNRRQPERTDLSGILPKRIVDIVVAIDTSGSMSDDDISYVMNEIFNIVKDREFRLTIVECDAEIGKVYHAKKMGDVQTRVTGRGGTEFTPVIEFINGDPKYKERFPEAGTFKNSVLIYFTDGYGESRIPRPMTYRNLWVVLKDESCLSLEEPYGAVKALMKDSNYNNRF